jgi:hypothetical protein
VCPHDEPTGTWSQAAPATGISTIPSQPRWFIPVAGVFIPGFFRDIRLFFNFPMPFIAAILHKGRSMKDAMNRIAMNVTEIQ